MTAFTAQKMKFSIKDFFSKCEQIRSFLWIWSHLMKKSLMGNFIFCAVIAQNFKPLLCETKAWKIRSTETKVILRYFSFFRQFH